MEAAVTCGLTNERRVIESLRTGVPGRHAVRMLGASNSRIKERFSQDLSRLQTGTPPMGFILEGSFGTGKSHLLAALRESALDANFACSIVSVSKEMTLASIAQLFSSAIRELRLPGMTQGGTCAEFVSRLRFESPAFADLFASYAGEDDSIESIFGATVQLFERYQASVDVLDAIIDFWDGGRCPLAQIKRDLRAIDLPYKHLTKAPAESRIGLPRLQFVAALLRAAGFKGWVILIDEVEMIAKLGLLARARSYLTLASLLGAPGFVNIRGLYCTAAITMDLWSVLLDQRRDRESLDNNVRIRNPNLAEAALNSLEFLLNVSNREELRPATVAEMVQMREHVHQIYERAYGLQLRKSATEIEQRGTRSLRSHLKEWITALDLQRQQPDYVPQFLRADLDEDLTEDLAFESSDDAIA